MGLISAEAVKHLHLHAFYGEGVASQLETRSTVLIENWCGYHLYSMKCHFILYARVPMSCAKVIDTFLCHGTRSNLEQARNLCHEGMPKKSRGKNTLRKKQ